MERIEDIRDRYHPEFESREDTKDLGRHKAQEDITSLRQEMHNRNKDYIQPDEAPGDVPDIAGEYQWVGVTQESAGNDPAKKKLV